MVQETLHAIRSNPQPQITPVPLRLPRLRQRQKSRGSRSCKIDQFEWRRRLKSRVAQGRSVTIARSAAISPYPLSQSISYRTTMIPRMAHSHVDGVLDRAFTSARTAPSNGHRPWPAVDIRPHAGHNPAESTERSRTSKTATRCSSSIDNTCQAPSLQHPQFRFPARFGQRGHARDCARRVRSQV